MTDYGTTRLSRLIALLTQLQTKRMVTAPELANRFSVSIRTIYRDIKTLENAGVPILMEAGKGYVLMDGYRVPPVMFNEDEANAIITAEQLVLSNKDASFVKNYGEVVHKIKAVLHRTTRDKANQLSERIKFYSNTPSDPTSHYLSTLQRAITDYTLVQITYHASPDQPTTRVVEPFALLSSTQENWLLVAWCRLRNTYRLFRLDRINNLRVQPETFEPHTLTLREYFEKFGK